MTAADDVLVDPSGLAAALAEPDRPTVLDVRWQLVAPAAAASGAVPAGRVQYDAGHIPGAVFLDLDRDLCGSPGARGRHPLPDPAGLESALRAAGVRADRPVVVYDGGDGMAAARAWWTLRWAGHPAVRVLAGGFLAWVAAGQPTTSEVPAPDPGDVVARPGALPVLDAAGAARLAAGDGVLIDVRAPERFRGDIEPIDPVAGHIPGAVNLPTLRHTRDTGGLRPVGQLREAFAGVGVVEGRPVGAYCGSGVTAAHTILALHVAGRPDAALYVGSWSHWITDPSRPVGTGLEAPDGD